MRGRKPKPTHLRLLAGGKERNPLEPKPRGRLVAAPDWFSDEQRIAWNHAIACAPRDMLRRLDQSALTVWVIACDTHRQAAIKLREGGLVTVYKKREPRKTGRPAKGSKKPRVTDTVTQQSVYLSIMNRQAQIMLKAAAELGFTPSSRSRVTAAPDDDETEESKDPLAEFGLA